MTTTERATNAASTRWRPLALVTTLATGLALAGCSGDGQPESAGQTPPTSAPAMSAEPDAAPPAVASTEAGAALYRTHCGVCHGESGRGDGMMAKSLNPPPRGFVDEAWRFIKPANAAEEQEAIEGIIRRGLVTSGMPGYGSVLSDEQIAQVASHVLSLRRAGGGG